MPFTFAGGSLIGSQVVLPGNPSLQPVCDSLTKLYACICAWWAAKRGFDLRATSNQMQRWQKEHLELFCSTYSKEACRPKNHFSLHVRLQWKEHNFTLDCYPCGRKHKLFKTIAPNFNELSKFSLSILSEMTHREIHCTKPLPRSYIAGKEVHMR